MASVATVRFKIISGMAGFTLHVVISVQNKVPAMVKGRWFPVRSIVATRTILLRKVMHVVLRLRMTGTAIIECIDGKKSMVKTCSLFPVVGSMARFAFVREKLM